MFWELEPNPLPVKGLSALSADFRKINAMHEGVRESASEAQNVDFNLIL